MVKRGPSSPGLPPPAKRHRTDWGNSEGVSLSCAAVPPSTASSRTPTSWDAYTAPWPTDASPPKPLREMQLAPLHTKNDSTRRVSRGKGRRQSILHVTQAKRERADYDGVLDTVYPRPPPRSSGGALPLPLAGSATSYTAVAPPMSAASSMSVGWDARVSVASVVSVPESPVPAGRSRRASFYEDPSITLEALSTAPKRSRASLGEELERRRQDRERKWRQRFADVLKEAEAQTEASEVPAFEYIDTAKYREKLKSIDAEIQALELQEKAAKAKKAEEQEALQKEIAARMKEKEAAALIKPLTPEQERKVDEALREDASLDDVLVSAYNVDITREHLQCLLPGEWLNDEVINFFVKLLNGKRKDCFAHNTFFYTKLSSTGYKSVARWTKRAKVDIFSKRLVVIPVHLGIHWCLGVINFEKKQFEYYDAMGGRNEEFMKLARLYVEEEHKDKKGTPFNTSDWKTVTRKDIPRQKNGYDCGVFMLMFADHVSANADFKFSQNDCPLMRKRIVLQIIENNMDV